MVRRIVTGNDSKGRSHVVIDAPGFEFGTLTELWATDSSPSGYGCDDEIQGRRVKLEPTDSGSTFRFFRIEPEVSGKSREDLELEAEVAFSAVDAKHCLIDTSRHPHMNKTNTVDYVVLLRGEVTLLLDDEEIDLKPFDVVIQRGTNHAWVNNGKEVAELVGVLVNAETRK